MTSREAARSQGTRGWRPSERSSEKSGMVTTQVILLDPLLVTADEQVSIDVPCIDDVFLRFEASLD